MYLNIPNRKHTIRNQISPVSKKKKEKKKRNPPPCHIYSTPQVFEIESVGWSVRGTPPRPGIVRAPTAV